MREDKNAERETLVWVATRSPTTQCMKNQLSCCHLIFDTGSSDRYSAAVKRTPQGHKYANHGEAWTSLLVRGRNRTSAHKHKFKDISSRGFDVAGPRLARATRARAAAPSRVWTRTLCAWLMRGELRVREVVQRVDIEAPWLDAPMFAPPVREVLYTCWGCWWDDADVSVKPTQAPTA